MKKILLIIFIAVCIIIVSQNNIYHTDLDTLLSLPYIQQGETYDKSGVTQYNEEKAYNGYTIINGYEIIDMRGKTYGYLAIDSTPYIISDGFFYAFAPSEIEDGNVTAITKYTMKGEKVWKKPILLHHSMALSSNNTILSLSKIRKNYNLRNVDFDVIKEFDKDGNIISNWSSFDHLKEIHAYHSVSPLDMPSLTPFLIINQQSTYDYYHMNFIHVLPENKLGIMDNRFQKGNLLISMRNTNLICILDKDTKHITWCYNRLERQHSPIMQSSGNILVFDNGFDSRKFSKIIELNPATGEVVWEYQDNYFYSDFGGSVNALPNGNLLIVESATGRIFEITRDKEIVWEWYCGQPNKKFSQVITTAERVDKKYLDTTLKESIILSD